MTTDRYIPSILQHLLLKEFCLISLELLSKYPGHSLPVKKEEPLRNVLTITKNPLNLAMLTLDRALAF
jgi:hypothetical protein